MRLALSGLWTLRDIYHPFPRNVCMDWTERLAQVAMSERLAQVAMSERLAQVAMSERLAQVEHADNSHCVTEKWHFNFTINTFPHLPILS